MSLRYLSALLAEAGSDQFLQRIDDLRGLRTAGGNTDRVTGARGQHQQAHDRRAADLDAILLDMDAGVEDAGNLNELRRGTRMQAALVDDRKFADDLFLFRRQGTHLLLRSWLATL